MNILLIPVLLPVLTALLVSLMSEKTKYIKETITVAASLIALLAAIAVFSSAEIMTFSSNWAGYNFEFILKADPLSKFILLFANGFALLTALYAAGFMKKKTVSVKWFCFNLLLTEGFSSGAILSDNLLLLLFFWEGLLIFIYTFIALSKENNMSRRTAMKAFIINGVCDLCFLVGITITGFIAGTMNMTEIHASRITITGWTAFSYLLILVGVVCKTGGMPFHTWIPDAGTDSNATFMAYVPAALDKLLGIYVLVRMSVYLYDLNAAMQITIMTVGAATLLLAVMMALVQKNYKRLLSYHAVSQAGYMILGVGTLTPVGIIGGLFHMLNNAIYKALLFFTAGSVENQTGTSDITRLGGLWKNMPLTALVFAIAALSISGVPPFNGFFSKEMIYNGTLESGYSVFFIIAEIGSILTLMSFLKLGHSVYFGKRPEGLSKTKEVGITMLAPMAALAALCVAFGFGAKIPVEGFFEPVARLLSLEHSTNFAGFHFNNLFLIALAVIVVALSSHIIGFKTGQDKAYKASDHINHALVLKKIYDMAQHRLFDPYEQIMERVVPRMGKFLFKTDRFMDYLTDKIPSFSFHYLSKMSRNFHTGYYPLYMAATILGFLIYVAYIFNFGGIR